VEFSNSQLAGKDAEILSVVEKELLQSIMPELGEERDHEAWAQIALLAANAGQVIEQLLRTQRSNPGALAEEPSTSSRSATRQRRPPTP
ncbi:unnamed protein product, partial [Polarella glacialis]